MTFFDNKLFLLNSKLPTVPIEFSIESRDWWREQTELCIEGKFVTSNGVTKWMPPGLYFYVNFWEILFTDPDDDKNKYLRTPSLRDIEWELSTALALARGLSGFENINIPEELTTEEKMIWLWNIPHSNPGSPLYKNQASNLMIMGPREFGKSEWTAGAVIAHEWLFNGIKKYYPPGHPDRKKPTVEIVVGAGQSSYSTKLLSKFMMGYNSMAKKGLDFGGKFYPHPLIQTFDGSLKPSKEIVAKKQKKKGGSWATSGTESKIRHAVYNTDSFDGQGGRSTIMVKEEIGMFENLIECHENDVEVMKVGTKKFGTCIMIGTGGDMECGTLGAYKMFYNPETYNILPFIDKWENKGKIGMFIPATKRANEFKDEQGITDEKRAYDFYVGERKKLKDKKNSKSALLKDIQYNPLIPSEVFMRTMGNIFPVADLGTILGELETSKNNFFYTVDLTLDEKGNIEWKPNWDLIPIEHYPLDSAAGSGEDKEGCVVMFEPPMCPEGSKFPEFERYIASFDPIAKTESVSSPSLACFLIYDTWTDTIVIEYTARPLRITTLYENIRRLLKLYNCRCLFENQYMGIYDYLEYKGETNLLLAKPSFLDEIIPNSKVSYKFGVHMTKELRIHCELKLYELLTNKTGNIEDPERCMMHNIRSIPLLQEFLMYDGGDVNNTDRVDALLILMLYLRQKSKSREIEVQTDYIPTYKSSFFSQGLFQRTKQI